MIKRMISAVLLLSLLLALCACSAAPTGEAVDIAMADDGPVSMRTEWDVYDKSIESVTCFITNSGSSELTYGVDYMLLRKDGNGWIKLFPTEDTAWIAIACVLPAGETRFETIKTSSLSGGIYRIVKTIDGVNYYAEFKIGKSDITALTPYGYDALDTLPKKYSAADAEKNGDLVIDSSDIRNADAFEHFLGMVKLGAPAMLRLTQYTVEGDPIISDIAFSDGRFQLTTDSTRDSFGQRETASAFYSYIISDGAAIFLSNCVNYEYAEKYLYGLERNTVLLTATAEAGWCSELEEISRGNLAGSITTMKVWSEDGESFCTLNAEGEPGVSFSGFSASLSLPADRYPGMGSAVGVAWIDADSFAIAAENNGDEVFKYIILEYDLPSKSYGPAYSGNGYSVENGGLVIEQ